MAGNSEEINSQKSSDYPKYSVDVPMMSSGVRYCSQWASVMASVLSTVITILESRSSRDAPARPSDVSTKAHREFSIESKLSPFLIF